MKLGFGAVEDSLERGFKLRLTKILCDNEVPRHTKEHTSIGFKHILGILPPVRTFRVQVLFGAKTP